MTFTNVYDTKKLIYLLDSFIGEYIHGARRCNVEEERLKKMDATIHDFLNWLAQEHPTIEDRLDPKDILEETRKKHLADLRKVGVPFYGAMPPSPHPVESKYPQMCKALRETVEQMYSVMLNKNMDYSSANILGSTEIGVVTRIWDKTARLMNLTGFDLKVEKAEFNKPKEPKNESVDDTIVDLANYAVILQLLRKGVWGK